MLKISVDFDKEMTRVRALYDSLSKAVKGHSEEYDLQRQVNDFITGIFIIRSGGYVISEDSRLEGFPFRKNLQGKRVVLYGGGTFGQQLMKRFVKDQSCVIVGWLDDDYWEYRRCCLNVDPIERITNIQYDYVLVASLDKDYVHTVTKRLLNYGVSESSIISVDTTAEERQLALVHYMN